MGGNSRLRHRPEPGTTGAGPTPSGGGGGKRQRQCNNPAPSGGGKNCQGDRWEDCNKQACEEQPSFHQPKEGCTLRCGTDVPHGWRGKGEGDNACNSCNCDDGALGCTEMGCQDVPCPGTEPVEPTPSPCPQPKCAAPQPGCASDEMDENGCPKYPCGIPGCTGEDPPSTEEPADPCADKECGEVCDEGVNNDDGGSTHSLKGRIRARRALGGRQLLDMKPGSGGGNSGWTGTSGGSNSNGSAVFSFFPAVPVGSYVSPLTTVAQVASR